jgi:hypothetical protein
MCNAAQTCEGNPDTLQGYASDCDRLLDKPNLKVNGRRHMLLITAVLITLIAALIIPRLRAPADVNAAKLGSMSDQWLAEHRASHES